MLGNSTSNYGVSKSFNYGLPGNAVNRIYSTPARRTQQKFVEPESYQELGLPQSEDQQEFELPIENPFITYILKDSIPGILSQAVEDLYTQIIRISGHTGVAQTISIQSSHDIHHITPKGFLERKIQVPNFDAWSLIEFGHLLKDLATHIVSAEGIIKRDVRKGHVFVNLIPLPTAFHHFEVHRDKTEMDYLRSIEFIVRDLDGGMEVHKVDNYPTLFMSVTIFTIWAANIGGQLFDDILYKIDSVERDMEDPDLRSKERQYLVYDLALLKFMLEEVRIVCKIAPNLIKARPDLYKLWQKLFVRKEAEV